jgi:WD40 repeat protein
MKRKVYASDRERKSNQLRGAIAFPLVNVPLWLITGSLLGWAERTYGGSPTYDSVHTPILLLPWFVNGLILTLVFLLRPQMGVGYIASIFLIIGAGIVLGGLFVVTCVLSLPAWFLGAPGPLLFLALFLGGLYYLCRWAAAAYREWWPRPGYSTLTGHEDLVDSLAFSPDGAILASGSPWDGTVRLWNVKDGTPRHVLEGHDGCFSPDGALLTSRRGDRVMLWRVADGTLLHVLETPAGWWESVAFSPDGATLASGSNDGTVWLWRVSDGAPLRTLEGHRGGVDSVAFSPDGATLASGSWDNTVRLWNVKDGTLLHVLEGRDGHFSPDGALLILESQDAKVRLWDVKDGTSRHVLNGRDGRFSPDGALLALGSRDGKVRLWDVKDGTLLHVLEGDDGCFSPDGALLVSLSLDGGVMLWRVADGTLLRTVKGPRGVKPQIAFAPDGRMLAIGSGERGRYGVVLLWQIEP